MMLLILGDASYSQVLETTKPSLMHLAARPRQLAHRLHARQEPRSKRAWRRLNVLASLTLAKPLAARTTTNNVEA